jgi:hypothetical protein
MLKFKINFIPSLGELSVKKKCFTKLNILTHFKRNLSH